MKLPGRLVTMLVFFAGGCTPVFRGVGIGTTYETDNGRFRNVTLTGYIDFRPPR